MALTTKRITPDGHVIRTHESSTGRRRTIDKLQPKPVGEVPGTVLARLIKQIPIVGAITAGCGSCASLRKEMDKKGCQWCDDNFDAILKHMRANHVIARLAPEAAMRKTLQEAIDTARSEAEARRASIRKPAARRRQRARNHRFVSVANSPTIPAQVIPFTGEPRMTLVFHVWPHGDGWKRHLQLLAPHINRFDRKLLGVAHDPTTATVADTVAAFETVCPGWRVFSAVNRPTTKGKRGLREVATYQQMLPVVSEWSTENDVTFCLHGKGVQDHTSHSDAVQWWIDAMYKTVYANIDGVVRAMEDGASIVGSFRRYGGHFRTRHGWHYSGTVYAFRNVVAFSNGVPAYRQMWWGTESWPGDHFPASASACLFGDNANDLYDAANQPRAALIEWERTHEN